MVATRSANSGSQNLLASGLGRRTSTAVAAWQQVCQGAPSCFILKAAQSVGQLMGASAMPFKWLQLQNPSKGSEHVLKHMPN